MRRPKFLKGQRLLLDKEEIVHFIEWRWDGAEDVALVKNMEDHKELVEPKRLKPLPKGQL